MSAASFSYDGRRFRPVETTPNGEVSGETLFDYHQEGEVVWATYRGGAVTLGSLVARVEAGGVLDMRYAHVAADGAMRTGVCRSVPETLPDGRLRLHETWRWTDPPDGVEAAGTSIVEEIAPDRVAP